MSAAPLAAWAPPASRHGATARRAVEAAARRVGAAAPRVVEDLAGLAALLAGPPGALLALGPEAAVREALAAGWVVVTAARHLDARPGRELLHVGSTREEVLARALVEAAGGGPALAGLRRAARDLGRALDGEAFAARWAPPRASIIIPVLDEPRVAEAVGSVLDQTLPDLEVVVVDDGSTDPATLAALAALDDPRVVRVSRPWGGPGAARNLGLALARGEDFIGFLDADDRWAPVALERLVEALDAAPARVGLAHADATLLVEGQEPQPWRPGDVDLAALARSDGLLLVGSFLVRRALAAAVRFDEDLLRGEDHAWLLEVAARGDLVRVPEALLEVRRGPAGQLATAPPAPARLARARARALEAAAARGRA